MKPQQFGDYTVRKLVEVVEPFTPEFTFHDWEDEALHAHRPWMAPHFVGEKDGRLTLTFSFHTYVVQAHGKTILIDTCIGNHKDRAALPFWHMQNRPYLENLYAMGIAPEDVDYVMCTHLHADHVGWNTRLENGRWVPTFPNARYIFSKGDYDHYNNVKPGEFGYTSLADSVFPIVDAGLAEIVTMDFQIGDGLSLVPSPGHTPGHYCVHLESGGHDVFFTGDMLHHPVLIAEPHWRTKFCLDHERSAATRAAFVDKHAGSKAIVLAAHFAGPTAGRITDEGGQARFRVIEGA